MSLAMKCPQAFGSSFATDTVDGSLAVSTYPYAHYGLNVSSERPCGQPGQNSGPLRQRRYGIRAFDENQFCVEYAGLGTYFRNNSREKIQLVVTTATFESPLQLDARSAARVVPDGTDSTQSRKNWDYRILGNAGWRRHAVQFRQRSCDKCYRQPRRGGRAAECGGLLILPELFARTDFRLFCLRYGLLNCSERSPFAV
jgi:hypothetical protein